MSIKKEIVILIVMLLGLGVLVGYLINISRPVEEEMVSEDKNTIYIWYTDEAIGDYLSSAAVAYLDEYGVRVVPELHSGLEFLESIYDASVEGEQVPDLYITGSDSIEKAAMLGLAIPAPDNGNILNQMNYPEVAVNAVTYNGQKFAYPFYYETEYMLYNATYLYYAADKALRDELSEDPSEEAEEEDEEGEMTDETAFLENQEPPEGYDREAWNGMIYNKAQTMIPSSIEDITDFANSYTQPDQVENIFVWDVSDIYYNYFFMGAYMDIGGMCGDDKSIVEIYNEDSVSCMQVYQQLNQFFSIDASTSDYDEVLDDFIAGKTIFTIATTDALAKIEEAKYNGSFTWDYSVASLPGVDGDHEAKGLSTTNAVYINGYSMHLKEADGFAKFVTNDYIDSFFQRTGKLATANGSEDYITDSNDLVREMYKESVSLPKLIGLSNFWLELELAYTKIWEGEDPDATLLALQEKMEKQLGH